MHRILLLDTETTGLPRLGPNGTRIQPRIVTISWLLKAIDFQTERERTYVVRPDGFTIPPEATNIHGISTEYAQHSGSHLQSVLQQLSDDCAAVRPQMVVAHNTEFDLPVVEAECQRVGIPNPLSALPSICTMQSTSVLCRIPRRGGGFKWPSLQELYLKLFARSFDGAHKSASDVRALFQCFDVLYRAGFYNEDFRVAQADLFPPEPPAPQGYVFVCSNATATDCLQKRLFGAPTDWPLSVAPGSICFLYNLDSQVISGTWRALRSGSRIDATAWGGRFPYQCRVELTLPRLVSLPRHCLTFLEGRSIPKTLPGAHLEQMIRTFGSLCNAQIN